MVSASPVPWAGLLGTQRSMCVRDVAEPKAPALCVGSFGLFLSKRGPGRGPSKVERDACAACLLRAGNLTSPGPRGRHAPAGRRPCTLDTYLPRPPCAPGGPRLGARALHLRPLEGTRCSRAPSFLDVARSETPTDVHTRCPFWKVEKRLPFSVDPFPPLRRAPVLLWPVEALGSDGLF